MTTEWAVVPLAEQFTLNAENAGELKFSVTNPGAAADTVVFDVIPGDGAQRDWFSVAEPQRRVGPNESVEFLVKLKVPAGTAPARADVVGLAYSANTAPEESSRTSGRVAFEWKPKEKPKPMWPWIAAAVALVLLVGSIVTWLIVSNKGKPEVLPSTSPSPSASPTPVTPINLTWEAESLVPSAQLFRKNATTAVVVQDNCCGFAWSGNRQLWFQAHAVDETLSVTFQTDHEATLALRTVRTTSFDYADTVWTVDGQLVGGTFAGYTADVRKTGLLTVGSFKLAAGNHTLTLRIVGKNAASGGYFAGVDQIVITSSGIFINPGDLVLITKIPLLKP
ncbi:hypothetical protein HDA40_006493 [Hamadaea flava]|uniref:Uncharacterized protein n=1 Tax=Hamadaea flava TaxID=1742688 RepID=A0ABV8LUV4_9ACTN|nr:hypothetical protein [Hamadaea flava]MCP2327986.1 hypothetical protein [Hamadaea flava]